MIAIVNVSPHVTPGGIYQYELRINSTVIAKFAHRRDDGLAMCLQKAADAAVKADGERMYALVDKICKL